MINSSSKYSDTKSAILENGYQLIAQQGFVGVGLKMILDSAGIPKGSFYHYFESKEAFGEELIRYYFSRYQARLESLSQQDITAQQRICEYFKSWYETQQFDSSCNKCLLVKLSGEIADISEKMRQALSEGYQLLLTWLSEQIEIGWQEGSIRKQKISSESLANRWYYAWVGASLMAKINHSNSPLLEVWQMTLNELGVSESYYS